jgi:FemAB-related protein (PEP-CTERM system-associated)
MVSAAAPARTSVSDACLPGTWDAYVERHPAATLYHRSAFRDVFSRAFGHRSHYLSADRQGRLVGVLPIVEFKSRLFGRFGVSLPFVNYGGLLVDDDLAAEALIDAAVALGRAEGWQHVELRHTARLCPRWPAKSHKVIMQRALDESVDTLWAGLDRKVRNLVRKSEKSGCVVEVGGPERRGDFYRVFAENMRDLGTPVYTPRFFDEVMSAVPSSRIFTVRNASGEVIAASLVLFWRERVEVPWASSLRRSAAQAPNMLLYWGMLKWAVEAGLKSFDFGRSTRGEGTYHFKKQWGASESPTVWEYAGLQGDIPNQGPSNPKFSAAIAAWKQMPLWLANALGPRLVRNIP